jgi:hypothetical protein
LTGAFQFDVAEGAYLLSVVSSKYVFPTIRIQVDVENVTAYSHAHGYYWNTKGPLIAGPLILKPIYPMEYFEESEKFNIMSLFMNPMILMSIVTFGLVFIMPKLQASMDEVKKDTIKDADDTKKEAIEDVPKLPEITDLSASLANWFLPETEETPPKNVEKSSKNKKVLK